MQHGVLLSSERCTRSGLTVKRAAWWPRFHMGALEGREDGEPYGQENLPSQVLQAAQASQIG